MSMSIDVPQEGSASIVPPVFERLDRAGTPESLRSHEGEFRPGSAVVGLAWGTIISIPIWVGLVLLARLAVSWI